MVLLFDPLGTGCSAYSSFPVIVVVSPPSSSIASVSMKFLYVYEIPNRLIDEGVGGFKGDSREKAVYSPSIHPSRKRR